jgi:alpha-glucuronidase
MQKTWDALEGTIDPGRFQKTKAYLNIQEKEAIWWKDACLLYFQTFSKKPFPKDIEQPKGTLEEFMKVKKRYVPGI